jgi:hypothetical protein
VIHPLLILNVRERKHQKEREDNWKHLQQKVERLNASQSIIDSTLVSNSDGIEEYNTNSEFRPDSPCGMYLHIYQGPLYLPQS